ncbi:MULTISPECIES: efflux RND transporter periplasmic adaptor subunit [unclassified Sinorhizobium]|uniref:efflux RND transporter periplasmic adaptor subunit n=1 Tax=unclassified Sinorhizobium TaxID=2613772 RepID=UPI0024C29EEF|nr:MULTISPECIES: efflux RND transporter periplasmic adaptor subunit [unclassified Sinorhizobium]MDK1377633.1 efflux RND transporter periplasmic adaptor subunit [Sinorhizobium sp. 6-70]MDK1481647.1 efflux RND transporter periplasmic adaptor subunit [Sinorhizobium sp. 6-117]
MFSPKALEIRTPVAAKLAAALAVAVALSACSEEKVETREIIRPVKVVEIAAAGNHRELDYSGSVKARTEMNLGFRVGGKITERLVNIGDRVKPGDLLARIDPTDYELAVKSAVASLAAAEKQVETTALTKMRAEQLFTREFSSKAELDQATLLYDQAVSTRDAAASSLDQARNQVAYTDLKSDQNGIVTAINADIGQVVGTGTPVVTVAVDGEKEVQVAVPEMDISDFKPGKTVKARFWSDDALVLDGKVREVSGSADQQSRTFSVRISLPTDPRVLLGMTATIEAVAANAEPSVSIPLSALAAKDGRKVVWVVNPDNSTVHARDVKLAEFTGDGVRIAEGLKQGDLVVAAGTQFMAEDLKVKLPATEQQAALTETGEVLR